LFLPKSVASEVYQEAVSAFQAVESRLAEL
jgi:hypothetical protein